MSNYENLLNACQEELLGAIYDEIENAYEDVYERYITTNGFVSFYREIYPEVERMVKMGLNNEAVREDMRQMDYGVDFDDITINDIHGIADDLTQRIVGKALYAMDFFD